MITAEFKAIDFILHQEAILSLMDFSNTLLASIQPAEIEKLPVTSTSSIETSKLKTQSDEKVKASQSKTGIIFNVWNICR